MEVQTCDSITEEWISILKNLKTHFIKINSENNVYNRENNRMVKKTKTIKTCVEESTHIQELL